MPMNLPRPKSDGGLEQMLRPSGLESMNSAQQYQKLISMRAQTAQMNREDQAMREFQRITQRMHGQQVRDMYLGADGQGFGPESQQQMRVDMAEQADPRFATAAMTMRQTRKALERQKRDMELSSVQLQGRPFAPKAGGGYQTSGAERAGARTADVRDDRFGVGFGIGRNVGRRGG